MDGFTVVRCCTSPVYYKERAMADIPTQTWPGMAAELFDLLSGRRAEITCQFENMEVHVPTHSHAPGTISPLYALWKFNGAITIRARVPSGGK
jgi:hypothetical protein